MVFINLLAIYGSFPILLYFKFKSNLVTNYGSILLKISLNN